MLKHLFSRSGRWEPNRQSWAGTKQDPPEWTVTLPRTASLCAGCSCTRAVFEEHHFILQLLAGLLLAFEGHLCWMVQCLRAISFLFALYEWPQELLANASCCLHEEQGLGDLMGKPVMALESVMEWNVRKWCNTALGLFHCSDLFDQICVLQSCCPFR